MFHVLRIFRREITTNKLGLTQAERTLTLEIVQKMSYASSEDEYMQHYGLLNDTNLKSVLDYFDANWHSIRNQWVNGLKNDRLTLQNRTNNRLECIDQKLKLVITKYSNLNQFCSQLIIALNALQVERDHRALNLFQKVPSIPFSVDSIQYQYMQLLTPYAFTFVLKQINCSSKVKLVINGDTFEGKNSAGSIVVAEETCTCSFWKTMQLQRRHIFALHSIKKLSLYHASLCALQWTQFYYKSNYNIADIEGYDQGDSGCMISAVSCKKAKRVTVLAQQDKYRKASHITTKLASLVSEAPMREFKQKLSTLEDNTKGVGTRWKVHYSRSVTIPEYLLARVIFGEFVCEKQLADFILAI